MLRSTKSWLYALHWQVDLSESKDVANLLDRVKPVTQETDAQLIQGTVTWEVAISCDSQTDSLSALSVVACLEMRG